MTTTLNLITQTGPTCDVDPAKLNESIKGLPTAVYFDLCREMQKTLRETLRSE